MTPPTITEQAVDRVLTNHRCGVLDCVNLREEGKKYCAPCIESECPECFLPAGECRCERYAGELDYLISQQVREMNARREQ